MQTNPNKTARCPLIKMKRLPSLFVSAAAALVVVLVVSLPAAEAGPLSKPENGQEPACACHDVDPRSEFWKPFVPGQDMSCL